MVEWFLAFRIFGDFERFLSKEAPNGAIDFGKTRPGAVEIWFAQNGGTGPWLPCVRWVPFSVFTRKPREERGFDWVDFDGNLPTKSVDQLEGSDLDTPENEGSKVYAFRVAKKHPKGLVLRYRGGAFFEQFGFDKNSSRPVLLARVPMVATDANNIPLCGIEIGQPENPGIRVQLAVPTSLPLGERWSRGSNSSTLAFAAVYSRVSNGSFSSSDGKFPADGKPLAFDTLVAGAPGATLLAQSDSKIEIGAFLFSSSPVNSTHYRSFATKDKQDVDEKSSVAEQQWTDLWLHASKNRTKTIATLLERLGLKTSQNTRKQLSIDSAFGPGTNLVPTSAGLWIDPPESGEVPSFHVLNRITLLAGSDSPMPDHDDHLRVKDRAIWLRLGGTDGGWSRIGPRLTIMADLAGRVSDVLKYDEHGSAKAFSPPPRLRLSTALAWSAPLRDMPGIDGIEKRFAAVLDGLSIVEGGQTDSTLATVKVNEVASGQRPFAIVAEGNSAEVEMIKDGKPIQLSTSLGDFVGGLLWKELLPLKLSAEAGLAKEADLPVKNALTLTFPLFDRATKAKKIDVDIVRLPPSSFEGAAFSIGLGATNKDSTNKDTTIGLASIGGLVFSNVSLDPTPSSSDLSVTSSIKVMRPAAPGLEAIVVFTTGFRLAAIAAIAPDVARGDRRPVPVLLDDRTPTTSTITERDPYTLIATETLGERTDRVMTAELREFVEDSTGEGKFVLLSREPFAIKRVIAERLDARGSDERSTVARYSNLDRAWLTLAGENVYHYVLPPQSVGESMDMPGRLEIHDAPAVEEGWTSPVPALTSPSTDDDSKAEYALYKNGFRRRVVEFRLTPPADLWVRPSDVARAFVPPEWAADAFFSQKGELGLGVALAGLRAEFVYGLPVAIDPTDANGPARRTRVAEIGALVGRPLDLRGDEWVGGGETLDGRWAVLRATLQTRPERLEVWADDPNSKVPFTPARFSVGAQFVLRHTALHRHPVIDAAPGGAETAPVPVTQDKPDPPRFHPHGLSGGALWPIESRSVLERVAKTPVASGGSIERIALSPLGGDADQTARFANNRVAIITETRGGYIQRQQIEVIGRIAVLWHRAKHVVVYERTVNPSAQFAPDKSETTRTRRPVLRKVQEYVEILQPERRYPDLGDALPSNNAFLSAVRFNSRIIPIDSSWAEDVPDGFVVPLWNRYAARLRPQVYRRPDIAFVVHAEGAGDAPEAAQECLNPENLFFFADTTKDLTDDTDRWAQRDGIDGTKLPPPSAGGLRGTFDRDAPIGLVPRGYERFTWRLAPPTARATVNAGRADKGVYAALDSVTFARGDTVDEEKAKRARTAESYKLAWTDVPDIKTGILGIWKRGRSVEGAGALPAVSAALAKAIHAVPPTLPETDADKQAFRESLGALVAAIPAAGPGNPIVSILDARRTMLEGVLASFPDIGPDKLEKTCTGIADDLEAKIEARQLVLRQELASWEAEADRTLTDAGADEIKIFVARFGSEGTLKDYLVEGFTAFIRPALDGATVEIGKLRRGIETARATVADTKAAVEAIFERLRTDLLAGRRAIEDGKPWSVDRIGRFRSQVDEAFDKAKARIREELADAKHRLATELDGMSQGVAGATAQALAFLAGISEDIGAAKANFAEWHGRIEAEWTKAKVQVREPAFAAKLADLKTKIEKAKQKPKLLGVAGQLGELVAGVEGLTSDNTLHAVDKAIADLKEALVLEAGAGAQAVVQKAGEIVAETGAKIDAALAALATIGDDADETVKAELTAAIDAVKADVDTVFDATVGRALAAFGETGLWVDGMVVEGFARIDKAASVLHGAIDTAFEYVDEAAGHVLNQVDKTEKMLLPDALATTIVEGLFEIDAVGAAMATAVTTVKAAGGGVDDKRTALRWALAALVDEIEKAIEGLAAVVKKKLNGLTEVCGDVAKGIVDAIDDLKKIADGAKKKLEDIIGDDINELLKTKEKYEDFFKEFRSFDDDMRRVGNDLAASVERAEAWGDRAIASIGDIGRGEVASAPNNILKALAAIGTGPELPNLDFARDRLGYYYGRVSEVVDTTPVEAFFGKLGDSLKAMGITLPFRAIGERLLPDDLGNFDIGRILGNFAGIDLSRLFQGVKMPKGAGDGLRLTHDFDRKTFRAWARIDIDIVKPGNASMFSIGPFTMDMKDTRLRGFLSLTASKDTDKVEEAGEASIVTDLAAIVSGQTMVTLREVTLRYDKGGGLKVEFDPANIKLNPSLEFIQKTLKEIFPDEVGGMEVVKSDGIPVGLRHVFQLPPLSLMAGTSGVQNIQISNRFELLAFPDFVIANRFALARPELPFIFSMFIIGGTGWLTVDVEYRPFDKSSGLLVIVEAGAGGSASLGFAFAGCMGSVFITLSLAITYRKLIGQSGGGLTVSLVVMICGVVDVLRIVSAQITVMLRLSYKENGDIDASGSFRITIRISRFFKISAGGQARYTMSGGKTERSSSSYTDYKVTDKNLQKAAKALGVKDKETL